MVGTYCAVPKAVAPASLRDTDVSRYFAAGRGYMADTRCAVEFVASAAETVVAAVRRTLGMVAAHRSEGTAAYRSPGYSVEGCAAVVVLVASAEVGKGAAVAGLGYRCLGNTPAPPSCCSYCITSTQWMLLYMGVAKSGDRMTLAGARGVEGTQAGGSGSMTSEPEWNMTEDLIGRRPYDTSSKLPCEQSADLRHSV